MAGARSPDRESSLPAMWSWVTSIARVRQLLGEGDADRSADRVEHDDRRPSPGSADRPRRRSATSITVGVGIDLVRRAAGPRAGALHDHGRRAPHRSAPRPSRTVTPSRWISRSNHSTSGAFGPATAASPPSRADRSTIVDVVPSDRRRPAPPRARPARRRSRRRAAGRRGAYQSGSSVSRPLDGSPMQVTIGLRTSRTWHVWLQRVHGRIRSASSRGELAPRGRGRRSGLASSRRASHTAADRRRRRAPTRPDRRRRSSPAGSTGTSTAACGSARHSVDVEAGRLVEVGSGLLGEKIEPRTTTR